MRAKTQGRLFQHGVIIPHSEPRPSGGIIADRTAATAAGRLLLTIADFDQDRRDVMAVADEEVDAIVAGDSARYFSLLTADAVFMPPSVPPLSGDDLRQWLRDFLDSVTVEQIHFAHGETFVLGDLAYHEYSCSWIVTPKAGGQPVTAHFKGVHLVQRMAGGEWKLARNIWNSSPAQADAL